jgi:hypothetical protein
MREAAAKRKHRPLISHVLLPKCTAHRCFRAPHAYFDAAILPALQAAIDHILPAPSSNRMATPDRPRQTFDQESLNPVGLILRALTVDSVLRAAAPRHGLHSLQLDGSTNDSNGGPEPLKLNETGR